METLAFLRAINVGKRRFPAADIVRVATELGFRDVQTHSSTGNLFFRYDAASQAEVVEQLERAFADDRGFDVPVVAFSGAEFRAIAADAEELTSPDLARHYVYLLQRELSADEVAAVEATASDRGRMVVRGRAAHALLLPGYEDGVVDPLGAAKLLGVATNRNLNVVRTLAAKWAGNTA